MPKRDDRVYNKQKAQGHREEDDPSEGMPLAAVCEAGTSGQPWMRMLNPGIFDGSGFSNLFFTIHYLSTPFPENEKDKPAGTRRRNP